MFDHDEILGAREARGRLYEALRPVAEMVGGAVPFKLSDELIDRVNFLVQPGPPFAVRVALAATEDAPAVDLGALCGKALPNANVLQEASLLFVAALCSALGDLGRQAVAAAAAARGEGGFVIVAPLADGEPLRLLLAGAGEDLGTARVLGAVQDAPLPMH